MKKPDTIQVICMESSAYYALVDDLIAYIRQKDETPQHYKWVDSFEAKKLLGISSDTTLAKYRDQGNILFARVSRKIILYDVDSIHDFITKKTVKN